MLVLSRKESERILIGDNIVVTVVRVQGDRVRLGIEAPNSVAILRGEIASQYQDNKEVGGDPGPSPTVVPSFN